MKLTGYKSYFRISERILVDIGLLHSGGQRRRFCAIQKVPCCAGSSIQRKIVERRCAQEIRRGLKKRALTFQELR